MAAVSTNGVVNSARREIPKGNRPGAQPTRQRALGSGRGVWVPDLTEVSCASDGKESSCNAGDPGSIPTSEKSPGGGNDNPLQYSCLENPMDRGAWWAIQSMGSQRDREDWMTHTFTFLVYF